MKRKSIISLFLVAICCFTVAIICPSANYSGKAKASTLVVSELFLPSNMVVQPSVIAEKGFTKDPGLLITSNSNQNKIDFKNSMVGEFNFVCAPVMQGGNPVVQKMIVTIEDSNSSQAFDIVIEYSNTTQVSVDLNGERAGLVYRDNETKGLTNLANYSEKYTEYTSLYVPVSFDAESMSVYVGEGDSKILVWCLTETEIDGRTVKTSFDKFTSYYVSISYEEFVGESAGVIFYYLNGLKLDRIIIHEDVKMQFFADFTQKGLVDSAYIIPKAIASDLYAGITDVVSVSVLDANGESVRVVDNTFVPNAAGIYTITYSASNELGVVNAKEYKVEVLEDIPAFDYSMDDEIPETVTVGDAVHIPQMRLSGGLLLSGHNVATVNVYRNGVKQIKYQNVTSGFDFTFNSAGNYSFEYVVANEKITYTVTSIKNDNPLEFDFAFGDVYSVGDYIDFSSANLYYNGAKTEWVSSIKYPDGKIYGNKEVILDQIGAYSLQITDQVSQKSLVYDFVVHKQGQDLFSSTTDGTTISFGTSIFTGNSGVYVHTKTSATQIDYNQEIDISKYVNQTKVNSESRVIHGEDKIYIADDAIPLISMSIEPNKYLSQVMRLFTIILTDAADPTNQVSVVVDSANGLSWSYLRAKAGSQNYAGYLQDTVEKDTGRLIKQDNGFLTSHSFSGVCNEAYTASQSKIELYYDNVEKQILTYSGWDNSRNGTLNCIVADFDNPALSDGLPWGGFTSDKVYLSIVLGTVTSGSAGCYIYGVDGMDFTAENFKYGEPRIDVEMPVVNGEKIETLQGLKGMTVEIPKAYAFDTLGNEISEVKTQVYFVNGNVNYNVPITNGKFSTPRVGEYVIKYFTTDRFLNYAEKRVSVQVYQSAEDLVASAIVDDALKMGKTGTKVYLLDKKLVEVENAISGYSIETKVKFGEEFIETDEISFLPEKAGTYDVLYEIKDGVGRNANYSYTISVELETAPVIVSAIPKYVGFIAGNSYNISDVYLIDYADDEIKEKKAEIYVDGQPFSGNEYKPEKIAPESIDSEEIINYVTIEYRYKGNVIDGLSYTIPVRNPYKNDTMSVGALKVPVTYFKVDRYFLFDDVNVSFTNTIKFTANETSNSTEKVQFIQGVESDNLKLSFNMVGNKGLTNVKSFTIYLSDALDNSKTVSIKIVKELDKHCLYISNVLTTGGFYGTLDNSSDDAFSFIFRNESKLLFDVKNDRKVGDVLTFDDGRTFDGFNGKVYLSFEIEKEVLSQPASFELWDINGQNFADKITNDTTAPSLTINGRLSGNYTYLENVVIPSASASDVLSDVDESSLTVTVKRVTASGEVVVEDINGVALNNVSAKTEHVIKLAEIGEYKAYYNVKDTAKGESKGVVLTFNSVVLEKPVITLSKNLVSTAKAGNTIKIPKFTVQFKEDNSENLSYVIYIAPSGRYQYIDASVGSFKATEVGKYLVRFFALDAYGNYNILEYAIMVSN